MSRGPASIRFLFFLSYLMVACVALSGFESSARTSQKAQGKKAKKKKGKKAGPKRASKAKKSAESRRSAVAEKPAPVEEAQEETASASEPSESNEATEAQEEQQAEAEEAPRRSRVVRRAVDPDDISSSDSEVAVSRRENRPSSSGKMPWFEVSAGMRVFNRNLNFSDAVSQQLRPYRLPAGPALAIAAEIHPALLAGNSDFLSNIGLAISYEHALGLGSQITDQDGATTKYGTGSSALQAGVQVRLPVDPVRLTARAGYGFRNFNVNTVNAPVEVQAAIPNINYQFLFAQGQVRWFAMEHLSIVLRAGFRQVLSTGALGNTDLFPRPVGSGLEGTIGVIIPLGPTEVHVMADAERYSLTSRPQPGTVAPATSTDQYLGVRVSLLYGL